MGAVVLERKKIGAGSVIAAGSVVVDDVPDHVQVMGVPARISKTGIEGK
jgi:acetyltransferase-like isoleucine patch superfamily enzyme